MQDTQCNPLSKSKSELQRIIRPGGIILTFGWSSDGVGMRFGFDIVEVLLVPHGGAHNDTICVVERKR